MLWMRTGPAKGQTFLCRRAPRFLRVVQELGGKWDALDQLEDTPAATEDVFAYEIVTGSWSVVFLCRAGAESGRWEYGHYTLIEPQPADATMRDNGRWQAWAREQAEAA